MGHYSFVMLSRPFVNSTRTKRPRFVSQPLTSGSIMSVSFCSLLHPHMPWRIVYLYALAMEGSAIEQALPFG